MSLLVYRIDKSTQAKKDEATARAAGYGAKFDEIMNIIRKNPYEQTPGHNFKRLKGNLKDVYSRRISYHNRFLYTIHANDDGAIDSKGNRYEGIVRVHEAWGHKTTE